MLIGLTGKIGSGKSTIAHQLSQMGYPVYDTDSRAKWLISHNQDLQSNIIQLLSPQAFRNNEYQTSYVAQRIFADDSLRSQLNQLVHPCVRTDLMQWYQSYSTNFCFVESAILFSGGLYTLCDATILITAPDDICLQRVLLRDHTNIDKVRARMRAQEKEFCQFSIDLVVNNDGKQEIFDLCLQIQEKMCNFAGSK